MLKKWMKRLRGEEAGFTLIELLVTIAILGVLFGIVTLTLTGVGANAQTTSCTAELGVVQSAVDIYMATNNLSSLAAGDQVADAQIDTGDTAWGDAYLRSMPTLGNYTVASDGTVSAGTCPAP
jgi:prepilin-type N-terminal cleavage/methylation domain-containing protein